MERQALALALVSLHEDTLSAIVTATAFRDCLWLPLVQQAVAAVCIAAVAPENTELDETSNGGAEPVAHATDTPTASLAHAAKILALCSQACIQRCRSLLRSGDDTATKLEPSASPCTLETALALGQALGYLVRVSTSARNNAFGNRADHVICTAVPWQAAPGDNTAGEAVDSIVRILVQRLQLDRQQQQRKQPPSVHQLQLIHCCTALQILATLLEFAPWLALTQTSSHDKQPSASALSVIWAATDILYELHRQLTADTLPIDPPLPNLDGEEKGSSPTQDQPQPTTHQHQPYWSLHRLFLVSRWSAARHASAALPQLQRGIVPPPTQLCSSVPPFAYHAIHRLCQTLSRLQALPLQRYALCCNPETGKPSSHLREFMQELQAPEGVSMRRQLLQDELVVTGLVRRLQLQGCGRLPGSDEALELPWTWLRDVVELRADVHDRHERDAGVAAALHGMATMLLLRRGCSRSAADNHEAVGGPEPEGAQPSYRNLHGTSTARIAGPPVSFLHATVGQRMHQLACMLEQEYFLAWDADSADPCDVPSLETEKGICELTVQEARSAEIAAKREGDRPLAQCLDDMVEIARSLLTASISSRDVPQAVLSQVLGALELIVDLPLSPKMRLTLLDALFIVAQRRVEEDIVALRYLLPAMCKLLARDYDAAAGLAQDRVGVLTQLLEHGLASDMGSVLVATLRSVR